MVKQVNCKCRVCLALRSPVSRRNPAENDAGCDHNGDSPNPKCSSMQDKKHLLLVGSGSIGQIGQRYHHTDQVEVNHGSPQVARDGRLKTLHTNVGPHSCVLCFAYKRGRFCEARKLIRFGVVYVQPSSLLTSCDLHPPAHQTASPTPPPAGYTCTMTLAWCTEPRDRSIVCSMEAVTSILVDMVTFEITFDNEQVKILDIRPTNTVVAEITPIESTTSKGRIRATAWVRDGTSVRSAAIALAPYPSPPPPDALLPPSKHSDPGFFSPSQPITRDTQPTNHSATHFHKPTS